MKLILWIYLSICIFLFGIWNTMADSFEYRKHRIAEIHLFILKNALNHFKKDMGRLPSTKENINILTIRPPNSPQWNGPYISQKGLENWDYVDGWGTKYIYIYPAKYGNLAYDLYSCGKNKINNFGQDDDITNWGGINFDYYNDSEPEHDKVIVITFILIILAIIITIVVKCSKNRLN
jgi:type II secretion system protein G